MSTFLLATEPIVSLDAYLASDVGGSGVRRAHELGPMATIDVVPRSGLRGRGGGGFPAGQKWVGIASQTGGRRYLACNGAEGEPARSRTVRCCAPTRTNSSRAWRSPRSRSVPRRRSSV